MATDWIGKTLGNCRVEEKIGEGGCGEVYLGLDLMLDRQVAIKVLHPRLAGRGDITERFRREAHAMARLSHPNVATVYSFHCERDNYLMIMEYVEGDTFEELLKKRGPMSAGRALPLLRQALDGVGHAHRQGILHRDLKATNLMLNESGVVKVMDFGIAEMLEPIPVDVDAATNPRSGEVVVAENPVGTPEYMSPEQARGEMLDARADVYALGVLLFKLLTGRLPIRGENPTEVMRAQIGRAPRPIRILAPEISEAVATSVERAMEKSISARFQDTEEFREALEEALGDEGATPITLDFHGEAPEAVARERGEPAPGAPMDGPRRAEDKESEPDTGQARRPRILVDFRALLASRRANQVGGAAAALVFVLLALLFARPPGETTQPRASRVTGSETAETPLYRLPPFEPRGPVGFAEWPIPPTDQAHPSRAVSSQLGPEDFGVIPHAPALPAPLVDRGATEGADPSAVAVTPDGGIGASNGDGIEPKKARARRVAKPQNRPGQIPGGRRVRDRPVSPPPPVNEVPASASDGGGNGWVIRR